MKTLKWNGERWYLDERSLWKRCRQWLIWIGGWEKANGKGWQLKNPYDPTGKQWCGPTPISLFGHRFTFFGWGFRVNFWRHPYWYFTLSHYRRSYPTRIYISRDGTPPRPDKPSTGIRIWPRAAHYWN